MGRKWEKESTTYLKRYAISKTLSELAERYETDEEDVEQRLLELKLTSKDGRGYQVPFVDPTIDHFEAGLKAYHSQKWADARKKFEAVIEKCEQLELTSRARLYIQACNENEEGAGSGPEDSFLAAVMAKNSGDLETALQLCNDASSKDERFAYLAASVTALIEDSEDEAMELLLKAIELNPENRIHAYHDSDFDALREVEAFLALYETEDEAEDAPVDEEDEDEVPIRRYEAEQAAE